MLDKVYFKSGHLTSLTYIMLESGAFDTNEKQLVLSHLSSCESCMESYLASLTEDSLIEPSAELIDTIMDNIGHIKDEMKEKSRKSIFMQFAKLSIAVCLTMGIFFSGALGFKINDIPESRGSNPATQSGQQAPIKSTTKPEDKKNNVSFFDGLYDGMNRMFTGFADQINLGYKGDVINGAK